MGVLDDPVYSVVNAGLVGLGRLEAKTAYERISGMLTDENLHVRKHAAIALGEIGDRRAIPEVRKLAKEDPDSGVRFMAGRALKKLEGTP
jgi:HEAT repeat protein